MNGCAPPEENAAEALTKQLVRRRSVNGTAGEAEYASFLASLLRARALLRTREVDVRVRALRSDPLQRSNVFALLRGHGPDVVLLTGHYDTVGTADFGELETVATDPDELTRWAIARAREGTQSAAWSEIASGEFLPGRGVLDMKSGLAAAIIAMERLADDPGFVGNVLLVASPDEEGQSSGVRSAVFDDLPDLLAEWGLVPRLAINLDATSDSGDGAAGQTVAFGTMGKLLLSAYFVGIGAHACYPQQGVNAAAMAARVALAIDGCPLLTERAEAGAPAPTTLCLRDLKPGYDVTTPSAAFAYWNIIVYERSPRDLLQRARQIAADALAGLRSGHEVSIRDYSELKAIAGGECALAASELGALDLPSRCRELMEDTWRRSGLDGPAVTFAFASVPYPSWAFGATPTLNNLRDAVRRAMRRTAVSTGAAIGEVDHLAVISDISFLAGPHRDDLRLIADSTPGWDHLIGWPLGENGGLEVPCINAGPWGRGYHGRSERVNRRYAFHILPDLVFEIAREVLAAGRQ